MGLLLGIDIGTTGTKVALVDPRRGLLAVRSRPTALASPHDGWAEAVTGQWWDNVCRLVPEVLAVAGRSCDDVDAVATTGMVPAVLVQGTSGPLRAAILQNDARAVAELATMAPELADVDLVGLTGSPLSQQSVAPTLRWLARHEPQVWTATTSVVGSYDWLLVGLGARPHVEWNWALESGFFTLDGDPIERVVTAGGADDLVPPVERTGTVVGEVSSRAARSTGLAAGTPLVVGGADHVLSAASAGLHQPGDTLVKLGGAGDILTVSRRPTTDRRLYLDSHPTPGLWLPNGCMATSGSLLRWIQGVVGSPYLSELDAEAGEAKAGDLICLPYFLGEKSPLHDPDLRGAFAGLSLSHTRGDLHRAALEAIAFGFRQHLEIFDELEMRSERIMVTNGGSSSSLWKQIVADVVGHDLIPVRGHPGASFGAAIAAGLAVGSLSSWSDASTMLERDDPISFDAVRHDRYNETYELWRAFATAAEPTSHALARRGRT